MTSGIRLAGVVLLDIAAVRASAAVQAAPASSDNKQSARVPWVAVDLGVGLPVARCVDCDLWYGGVGFAGSFGAGVSLRSTVAIGVEQTGMAVFLADSPNSATLKMLTVRVYPLSRFALKLGVGKGRYTIDNERLVDDRPTALIGVEMRRGGRVEVASFVEAFQSTQAASRATTANPCTTARAACGSGRRCGCRSCEVAGASSIPGASAQRGRIARRRPHVEIRPPHSSPL